MKYCPECGAKIEEIRKFCPECGFKFSSQTKLENDEPQESKNYIIDDKSPEELENIFDKRREKTNYERWYAKRSITQPINLNNKQERKNLHQLLESDGSNKNIRTCPVCGKKFIKGWRQIRCRDCEKDFKLMKKDQSGRIGYEATERYLQQITHNREYPFYCKWCGKRFKENEYDICERHENYHCPKRR